MHYVRRYPGLTATSHLKSTTTTTITSRRLFLNTSKNTTAPTTAKLIYPDSPSSLHHDMSSFLTHAQRTNLDVKSPVYVGTHYEYTVARALSRYGFELKRIGGASDFGIDLIGTWLPPSPPIGATTNNNNNNSGAMMRVLIQCKAHGTRMGPSMIRELEGAFVGAPAGWRGGKGLLGLLLGDRPATKGIRDGVGRSRWPMGYVCCERDGGVRQMIWNRRAEEEGLEGFGVTWRFSGGEGGQELVLMRNGRALPLLGEIGG